MQNNCAKCGKQLGVYEFNRAECGIICDNCADPLPTPIETNNEKSPHSPVEKQTTESEAEKNTPSSSATIPNKKSTNSGISKITKIQIIMIVVLLLVNIAPSLVMGFRIINDESNNMIRLQDREYWNNSMLILPALSVFILYQFLGFIKQVYIRFISAITTPFICIPIGYALGMMLAGLRLMAFIIYAFLYWIIVEGRFPTV